MNFLIIKNRYYTFCGQKWLKMVGGNLPSTVAKKWVQEMNKWFTQAMDETAKEKATFAKLASYIM